MTPPVRRRAWLSATGRPASDSRGREGRSQQAKDPCSAALAWSGFHLRCAGTASRGCARGYPGAFLSLWPDQGRIVECYWPTVAPQGFRQREDALKADFLRLIISVSFGLLCLPAATAESAAPSCVYGRWAGSSLRSPGKWFASLSGLSRARGVVLLAGLSGRNRPARASCSFQT